MESRARGANRLQQTQEHDKARKRGDWQRVNRIRGLSVTATGPAHTRALRIMHALIRGLEKRGYTVSVADGHKPRTVVSVLGEELEIRVSERSRRVIRPAEEARSLWAREYDFEPTGRLTLEICEHTARRKSWTDGKRQRIEDCLNQFVVSLVETAVAKAKWRQELDERQRRWAEEVAKRRRRQLLGPNLEKMAAAWTQAESLRSFVAEARRRMETQGDETDPRLRDWLAWATDYIKEVDPLSSGLNLIAEQWEPDGRYDRE